MLMVYGKTGTVKVYYMAPLQRLKLLFFFCLILIDLEKIMIEFAKLHVEAALKAASEGQIKKDIYKRFLKF